MHSDNHTIVLLGEKIHMKSSVRKQDRETCGISCGRLSWTCADAARTVSFQETHCRLRISYITNDYRSQVCWHTSTILVLGTELRIQSSRVFSIPSKFEASMGYMTLDQTKKETEGHQHTFPTYTGHHSSDSECL